MKFPLHSVDDTAPCGSGTNFRASGAASPALADLPLRFSPEPGLSQQFKRLVEIASTLAAMSLCPTKRGKGAFTGRRLSRGARRALRVRLERGQGLPPRQTVEPGATRGTSLRFSIAAMQFHSRMSPPRWVPGATNEVRLFVGLNLQKPEPLERISSTAAPAWRSCLLLAMAYFFRRSGSDARSRSSPIARRRSSSIARASLNAADLVLPCSLSRFSSVSSTISFA